MAAGISPYMYLIVGEDDEQSPRNNFYRIDLQKYLEGEQGTASAAGKTQAHAVSRYDGIEVEYQLPATARVHAALHDAVGRHVGTLDVGEQKPGVHRLSWDRDREGRKLNAGAYFVLLDMGAEQARLKAIVR